MQHNYKFEEFMDVEFNTIVEDYFSKYKYPEMNGSLSSNFFALDELGIPIRQDAEGKKTVFGWYRIDDKFYHHAVEYTLLEKLTKEEVKEIALRNIKRKHKTAFSPRSQMKKYLDLYSN